MSNKCLKGNLGDVTNQWSAWAQKKFRKKTKKTEIHFSTFIENQNLDLKFFFRFDTENEKRKKKSKFYFILKQKSNVLLDPRIGLCT